MKIGLAIIIGYLIGSIPFSYIVPRWLKGVDVRRSGTGNVGAANVYLTSGLLPALLACALDIAKGATAVLVARRLTASQVIIIIVGFAAIIGHIRPIYLRFVGGKGISTTCGVLVSLVPKELLIALGIWIVIVTVTKYAALAGLIAGPAVPVLVWYFIRSDLLVASSAIMILILALMTASNIKGLFVGTERKIGEIKNRRI